MVYIYIGGSKTKLRQRGSGLKVALFAAAQPDQGLAIWEDAGTYEVLNAHQWIEPQETISDEVLFKASRPHAVPAKVVCRLVWDRRWARDTAFESHDIILPNRKNDVPGEEREVGEGQDV